MPPFSELAIDELARKEGEEFLAELTEASEQDPYEFFSTGSSSNLCGDRVDELLAEHWFGHA